MKHLLSKSLPVVAISFFTALCVTIIFSTIVYAFKMAGRFQDGLSDNYKMFTILQFNEEDKNEDLDFTSLFAKVDHISAKATLLRYDGSIECGVYQNKGEFDVSIKEGRSFSKEDFVTMRNVALVSEEQLSMCVEQDGIRYISVQDEPYEVVGVFCRSRNRINPDAYVYYNLNTLKPTSRVNGQYAVDAGAETVALFDEIANDFPIQLIYSADELTFSDRLQTAVSSQQMAVFPFILVVAMVLLNSINISFNWLDKRRQELSARRICGATANDLFRLLSKDYFMIVTFSYIFGLVASIILAQVPLIQAIGVDFSPLTVILSYLMTMIAGTISVTLMLISARKKTVAEQRRLWS